MKKVSSARHGLPKEALRLSRRELLKLLGGGIVVLIYPPPSALAQSTLPSAYLQIAADGTVTIFSGKVEYGQGVMTSLAQMAAEELDVPLASMRAVMGDTGLCPIDPDGGTWGSLTTRNFGPSLRNAAARARAILLTLASEQLGLPEDQLMTQAGYVVKRSDTTVRVSYATLAGGKTINKNPSQTPKLKNYSQFIVSGKPALRIDALEKVTGQAKYAADIRLPGMLYARILRPPAHGAKLKSVDTAAAEQVPGVRLIRTGSLIAVLHEQPEIAEQALAQINAVYDLPQTGPDGETIYDYLVSRYPSGTVSGQRGNLTTGEQLATTKVERTYYTPYLAHASIETHTAIVSIEGSKATVWAATQTPSGVRGGVAGILGMATNNVRVITPYVGGGFGGKASFQQALEAAQLAKAAGKPVHLAWTREEEFLYDNFQPAGIVKIRSGLDQSGKIVFWDSQVYCLGDRGAAMFYNLPNYRTRTYGNWSEGQGSHPFAVGPWRAPGNNANTFARESQIDALAAAAGIDALEFRLQHLQNARLRAALDQAASRFGWQPAKSPSGRGVGVACAEDAGAYVAMMAEVEVDPKTGVIRVKRMLCALDLGQVINPEGARMQMEGSMMMGLGYALTEEIKFDRGRILTLGFDAYQLPRFSSMPKLETVIVENNFVQPQGGGEPPIITVGGVVANAAFDAVGVRLTRLPLTPGRVLAAIRAGNKLTLHPPARAEGQLRLSWDGAPGIKLQQTPTLTNPTWQEVSNTDGQSLATLPLTNRAGYYRLVKP